MPTMWETFPIKFEGGWRTDLGRLEQGVQAPGSATVLRNFEPDVKTGYTRILGYTKFSSTAVTGTGLIGGVIIVDDLKVLAYRQGKYYTSTGTTWTERATSPSLSNNKIRYDSFNWDGQEKFILVDGVNDPAVYNPADNTVSYDTGAPANVTGATIVKAFKNHIFFAKNNSITFPIPYTTDDWDTGLGAGEINVGYDITGLVVFRDQLIIFTTNTIHRLVGNTFDDFQLLPISINTGCLHPDTIQDVGGDILYLAPDGIRFLSATERNEDFALERASSNIQSVISSLITSTTDLNSMVIRSKNQYRIFPYVSALESTLSKGYLATRYSDQSVVNLQWAETQGIKVYVVDNKQFSDREVVIFSNDSGYVYRMENGNSFDGGNINAVFETPYMPITDPRIRKTIYKHSVYMQVSGLANVTTNLFLDYRTPNSIQPSSFLVSTASGSSVYGTAVYGTAIYGGRVSDTITNNTIGSGFVFALRYESNDTSAPYTLYDTLLEYKQNERR